MFGLVTKNNRRDWASVTVRGRKSGMESNTTEFLEDIGWRTICVRADELVVSAGAFNGKTRGDYTKGVKSSLPNAKSKSKESSSGSSSSSSSAIVQKWYKSISQIPKCTK